MNDHTNTCARCMQQIIKTKIMALVTLGREGGRVFIAVYTSFCVSSPSDCQVSVLV